MAETTKISKKFLSAQKSLISDKSLFIELLGDTPQIRILDYLLTESNLDFSITDIAKNAGVGRATLYRIWDTLIKQKILVHTRDIGRARLYKLNTQDPKIKKLMVLYNSLVLEELGK